VDVVMPQMGESIFEGTITKWLKKVGEKVQPDEPLFEISTDKVDAEIPHAGRRRSARHQSTRRPLARWRYPNRREIESAFRDSLWNCRPTLIRPETETGVRSSFF
jgi:hypothetical protein